MDRSWRNKQDKEGEKEREEGGGQKRGDEKEGGGGLVAMLKCKVMIYLSMLFCCTPNLTETLIHV